MHFFTPAAGLMSTKVWLKRGAEVATGTGSRSAAQVSDEASDTTDFQVKLQDASLTDVLVHGYLGIIFGEPGWPYPEVQLTIIPQMCVAYKMVDGQRGAHCQVDYNHLVSNKCK